MQNVIEIVENTESPDDRGRLQQSVAEISQRQRRRTSTALAAGGEAQTQRVELDEALGVALVVDLVFLERHVRQAVEAVRRLPPDD